MARKEDVRLYSKLVREHPETFAGALADAGLGIFVADWQSQTIDYNSTLRTAFGLDEVGEISSEDVFKNLVHPDDIDQMQILAEEKLPKGESYSLQHRLRDASGRYFPCTTHIKPVLDSSAHLTKVVGVMRNQDDLERAAGRMDRAERTAGLGNFSIDLQTGEVLWSPGIYLILGYEIDEFQPDVDFARQHFVDPDAARIGEIVDEALRSGSDFEFRGRMNTKTGDTKHIHVLGEVEFGSDGNPIAYSGILRDITDEVLREAQISQSQKIEAIGNMTGGAAHDFNNLLAVILGNLELIREEVDRPELIEQCDAAIAATLSGATLTRNMLSFARRAKLDPKTLDTNEVVRSLDRWARRTMPATIETEVSLQAGLWKTDLDKGSLESALLNLILNARDAMLGGGKLTIETANVRIDEEYIESREEDIEPGRYVMLAVSDTGTGIQKEELQRIFEPFFTTKGVGEGTGLGLSMVQGFVKQSLEAIRVYSESGEGTTFKLYFRARHVPKEEERAAESPKESTAITGQRILLAEDELEVQRIISTVLRKAGYQVHSTNSGDEAKAAFEVDQDYDLLLTDIVMPGSLQGTTLAKELRTLRHDLPVVFMSGYASEATVHGNGLRPEDIRLMKPVRKANLLQAVKKAIGSSQQRN